MVIVTPTYNERGNLPIWRTVCRPSQFSVNGRRRRSPDGTGEVADELGPPHPGTVEVMHRTGPRGLGRSYIDGLRRALEPVADLLFRWTPTCRKSGVSSPGSPRRLSLSDVVIGSRYLTGVERGELAAPSDLFEPFANGYIRAVTRFGARTAPADSAAGGGRRWPRCRSTAFLTATRSSSRCCFEAAQRGCRIGEVPIIFVERRQGRGEGVGRVLVESLVVPWRLVLRGYQTPKYG